MAVQPHHLHAADIGPRTLPGGAHILGIIGYGAPRPPACDPGTPFAEITMDALCDSPPYEVWATPDPAGYHESGGIIFATAGHILFGTLHANPSTHRLEEAAYDLYTSLFALADRTGHRHIHRVFNYLSAINAEFDGTERYRRFNAGRHDAFIACGRTMDAAPAACALGMRAGPPAIAFLASSDPGQPIENPRQISAYRYPPIHGPSSPSFSRAMLTPSRQLHISGTASIVGHESLHVDDASAQTEEILRNLDALLSQAGQLTLAEIGPSLRLKTYIRNRQDAPAIQKILAPILPTSQIMFIEADICRQELLVEIEAFCQIP